MSKPRKNLDRGGGMASGAGLGVAFGHVGSNEVEQLIVVEEAIELLKLGVEVEPEWGNQGEEIARSVVVFERTAAKQKAWETLPSRTAH